MWGLRRRRCCPGANESTRCNSARRREFIVVSIRRAIRQDLEAWNNFVYSTPLGTTYHSREWINVHKRSLGAQIVELVATEEGKMVGVFPFTIRPRSIGQIFGFETSFIAKEVASPPAVM